MNEEEVNPFEEVLEVGEIRDNKTSMVLDVVVEQHVKEAVKVDANMAREFKELLKGGDTPQTAAGKLGITSEDVAKATSAGKKMIKGIIDEWSVDAGDRKALTRGLLNKIAVESAISGEFDTSLKAIDMIQADPEVGIKGQQASGSLGGLFHPSLLGMMNKLEIQDAEIVEGGKEVTSSPETKQIQGESETNGNSEAR